MRGPFARFIEDRRGVSAVEFAVSLPLLLLILGGFVELGRAHIQAEAVEKGLRAGVLFAARSDRPDDPGVLAQAFNLVRTGSLDGSEPFLTDNWGAAESRLTASFSSVTIGTRSIPVVRFTAEVPYEPMVPGLAALAGLGAFTIRISHDQAYVGR